MPSRDEEPLHPRRRRKEYDQDGDSTSSRDKPRAARRHPKSASSSNIQLSSSSGRRRSKSRDKDATNSTTNLDRPERTRKVSVIVPEMDRRPSLSAVTRSQAAYPSFSKAHSREAVGSREDIGLSRSTTTTSDLSNSDKARQRRRNSTPARPDSNVSGRSSPSQTLTADRIDVRRSNSGDSTRKSGAGEKRSSKSNRISVESTPRASQIREVKSGGSLRRDGINEDNSEISSMPGTFPEDLEHKSTPTSTFRRTASSTNSQARSNMSSTTITDDSDATSVAVERKGPRQPIVVLPYDHSPPSVTDSQPKTPTGEQPLLTARRTTFDLPQLKVRLDSPQSFGTTTGGPGASMMPPPPPPPPPPPMADLKDIPRVDYLLKHGGLMAMVPKRLVQVPPPVQQYAMYQTPMVIQQPPLEEYAKIFSSIHKRLDDYMQVLRNHGSLAVATGYKSVARRLLDKLSQVFARDISSQRCDCVICQTTPQPSLSDEEDTGVSWGEILEFTAGRQVLPQWPPFKMSPEDKDLNIPGTTPAPMQKLDIDVPEEYRDHYIRQNQKTKRAVQAWLSQQPELPTSPPEEADEDTLMFAMMTKLNVTQRNYFIALMHGQSQISEARAPTPAERPSTPSTALKRARTALQRLYRLDRAPRDCESAMYLLNNPSLHGMLATLAEVNDQEWDILVSGRFDGFLWSGAEQPMSASVASPMGSRAPSRAMNATPFSRTTTPFSGLSAVPPSRGTTPFSPFSPVRVGPGYENSAGNYVPLRGATPSLNTLAAPAPVQLDEDTEIAILAEVERNLFQDMERFEDAFEILHSRAELVRQMLRERSAGLSVQAQLRRGSNASDAFVRLDTPASGFTDFEDEEDDGLGDTASLAPDDSASQIGSNRRKRHHRERRTPAPVQEEDEPVYEVTERRVSGRRSKY